MEVLATNRIGCTLRGLTLAKECELEGHTIDETEYALGGLMADVTEYTVQGFVANETERVVMAFSAVVTQYAAMWHLLLMQWNELWKSSLSTRQWLLC